MSQAQNGLCRSWGRAKAFNTFSSDVEGVKGGTAAQQGSVPEIPYITIHIHICIYIYIHIFLHIYIYNIVFIYVFL